MSHDVFLADLRDSRCATRSTSRRVLTKRSSSCGRLSGRQCAKSSHPRARVGNRPQLSIGHLNLKVHSRWCPMLTIAQSGFPAESSPRLPERTGPLLRQDAMWYSPYPGDLLAGQCAQPLHRDGKMGTSFAAGNRMYFVQNDGAHARKTAPAALGCKENIERFRSRDPDMGRLTRSGLTLICRSIARTQRHGAASAPALRLRQFHDLLEWNRKVAVHIIRERFQRRDVYHMSRVTQRPVDCGTQQPVYAQQKGGKRFS